MDDKTPDQIRTPVVAGVIRDALGRVLVAQRQWNKQFAGLWEFPGGKVEAGESPQAALSRELEEELGIRPVIGRRLIAVPYASIVLEAFEVESYSGQLQGRENQALVWIQPADIDPERMPPADRPVLGALLLPDRYLITPPSAEDVPQFLGAIEHALGSGIRLVQLRLPGWPRNELAPLARAIHRCCRQHDARLLLNADFQLALVLGLDGVHLPAQVAAGMVRRPINRACLLGVSCHTREELDHAAQIGADFATLSPVRFTPGHADAIPLGWTEAASLIASAPIPVYALGGLGLPDLASVRELGAQGIAAIRGLWRPADIA